MNKKAEFTTASGLPVNTLYSPVDLPNFNYESDLGFPGQYPFTRGVYPDMYRGKFWTMRMTAGYGTATETNQRFRYLLEHGETGLSVANDTPTLMGLDSDDPRAEGEVGRTGVAIDSLMDIEEIFDGIPIDKVSVALINVNVAYCELAMYLAMAEKRGIPFSKLVGSTSNDPIRNFICMSGIVFPLRPSVRFTTDSVKYCVKHVPKWNPVTTAGYHIREWGITAIQEAAFTIAQGIGYVEEAIKAGLSVDEVAPCLAFYFNANTDIFEEVAKYRAIRRAWAKVVKGRFKAENPNSMRLRFHVQTAGHTLTAQEPENNIVRVSLQALAAVLGGAQSLHTNCWDEAFAIPSESSVKLALRTQQIIAEESGAAVTVDPLAGSYYVESLTNTIEEGIFGYLEKVDSLGGVIAAAEEGFFQSEIVDTSYNNQNKIRSGEKVVVGVNKYVMPDGGKPQLASLLKVSPEVEQRQRAKLKKLRQERDNREVSRRLEALETCAREGAEIMPPLIEAAEVYTTIGEMVGTLKKVVGEFKEPVIW